MIELKNVKKNFGKKTVIDDITATFSEGTIVGVIGRNGCGKTVLFKMICGLMLPSSGTIVVNGETVGKDVDFPDSMGIIIESPQFSGNRNARDTLMELAVIKNRIGREEVEQTLKKVGLNPDEKKKVSKYSLGMRQRLGIAQAIMENPKVLILDEPMNGLDKHGVEDMRKLFFQLKEEGKTILLASHNREDIELLCDVVYEMENGKLNPFSH